MVEALESSLLYDAEYRVRRVVTRAHGTLHLTDYSGSVTIIIGSPSVDLSH